MDRNESKEQELLNHLKPFLLFKLLEFTSSFSASSKSLFSLFQYFVFLFTSFGWFSICFLKYSFCSLNILIKVSIYIVFSIAPFWLNSFLSILLKFSKEFVVLNFIFILLRFKVLSLKYSIHWLLKYSRNSIYLISLLHIFFIYFSIDLSIFFFKGNR